LQNQDNSINWFNHQVHINGAVTPCLRKASHTNGPMVKFGTNDYPSNGTISAPASKTLSVSLHQFRDNLPDNTTALSNLYSLLPCFDV
jgi:hypothetical protein